MTTTDLAQWNSREAADSRARSFVKWIFANGIASRDQTSPIAVLEGLRGAEPIQKAAVAALSSGNADALLRESRAFVDLMLRATVLGRLSGALNAPPNTPIPGATTDPVPAWVVEGAPIPMGSIDFAAPRTSVSKYSMILAFARELFRAADDRAFTLIERVSLRALRHGEDALLLSDAAAVTHGNPAGLLAGLSAAGAGSPATLTDDFSALWTSVEDGDPDRPFFVLSPRGAMYLAALNTDGTPLFPGLSLATGGTIFGVPVLLSKAAGANVVLIDAAKIAVSDEGLKVTPSTQATVQMDNAPTAGATNVVSVFQTGTALLRFIRYIHWTKLSADAVGFLELPINGSPA